MRFEVLGPVTVLAANGGPPVPVSDQRRLLLALLLVRANQLVSTDVLAEALWGADRPEHPGKSLQMHVHRLRKALDDPDRLRVEAGGYRLRIGPGELDATEFADLCRQARLQGGHPELLRRAHTLWHGDPYAGLDEPHLIGPEQHRLAELRLSAYEELYEAELAAGAGRELVPELTELVARYPLREALTAHLMRALDRDGRRHRALTAYRQLRKRLGDRLDAQPGARLRDLAERIEAGSPEPAAGPPLPAQLPPVTGGFVGREEALAELEAAALDQQASLLLITGTAGVGKTSLAVRYAHSVADRFGAGQLHLDLRGHSAQPALTPVEALAHLLRGLGADPRRIPADVEQATAEYRSLTSGRKLLVLLDNAASAEQVRPLLPATPGCLALVTSREQLSGLVAGDGAYRLTLRPLDTTEAWHLLAYVLGTDRLAAEPGAVAALAEACARLPLALRIAAAQLADQPHRPVADYLAELRAAPMSALAIENDLHSTVGAAFELSYERLDAASQRLFRLLGLVPGPDLTAGAAAALVGMPVAEARRHLARLTAAHLVEEHAHGRFRFHDLQRDYARLRAEAGEPAADRSAALDRLFGWYYLGKQAAMPLRRQPSPHLAPPPVPADLTGPELVTTDDAVAWSNAEHANIAAIVRHAAESGPAAWSWHLLLRYAVIMVDRGLGADCLALVRAAERAARAAGDQVALAHVLAELGTILSRSDLQAAITTLTTAAALAEQAGELPLLAYCLNNLGVYHQNLGDLAAAAGYLDRSLDLKRATGHSPQSLGITLNNLARLACMRGDLRAGIRQWEQVLELRAGAEDSTLVMVMNNLLVTRLMLGELAGIEELFEQSERLAVRLGELADLCRGVHIRATLLIEWGRHAEALERLERLRPQVERLGQPRIGTQAAVLRGTALARSGRTPEAVAELELALAIARSGGDRELEAEALRARAELEVVLEHWATAGSLAREALAIARECNRMKEADALLVIARVEYATGRAEETVAAASEALGIYQASEHLLGQARALRLLGQAGPAEQAASQLSDALRLFEAFGSPEAVATAEELRAVSEPDS